MRGHDVANHFASATDFGGSHTFNFSAVDPTVSMIVLPRFIREQVLAVSMAQFTLHLLRLLILVKVLQMVEMPLS